MRECLQNWTFVKVKSHSKLHTPDPLQRWLTFYNDEADTFAKEVNRCEWPQKVRDLQASLHQQLTDRKRVIALVQEFHTQVANIMKPSNSKHQTWSQIPYSMNLQLRIDDIFEYAFLFPCQ